MHGWDSFCQRTVYEVLGVLTGHGLKVSEVGTLKGEFEDLGDLRLRFGLLRLGLAHDHSRL